MLISSEHIGYVSLTDRWGPLLVSFFSDLAADSDSRWFHPHPLTPAAALEISRHRGRDIYLAQTVGGEMAGYGMLRGWDAGYDAPSLGIAVHPRFRGRGLAEPFMHHLHDCAAAAAARCIRIKVYDENKPACRLYRKLGYTLSRREGAQWIGWYRFPGVGETGCGEAGGTNGCGQGLRQ